MNPQPPKDDAASVGEGAPVEETRHAHEERPREETAPAKVPVFAELPSDESDAADDETAPASVKRASVFAADESDADEAFEAADPAAPALSPSLAPSLEGPPPAVAPVTSVVPASVLSPTGGVPGAPFGLRLPPPPRPPVVPERTDLGWKTPNLTLSKTPERSDWYVDYQQGGATHRVYLATPQLRRLTTLATSPNVEPGAVWKKFCELPLSRPLPSRTLDEELRLCLIAAAKQ